MSNTYQCQISTNVKSNTRPIFHWIFDIRHLTFDILRQSGAGFALVELLLVLGIIAVILGIVTISLTKVQRSTSLAAATETLISDFKSQQLKAMNGASETGSSGDNYGISFNGTNTYILFRGTKTTDNPPTNNPVSLDSNITVTSNPTYFYFKQKSGEVSSLASITIRNTSGTEQKTLNINTYGAIQ